MDQPEDKLYAMRHSLPMFWLALYNTSIQMPNSVLDQL